MNTIRFLWILIFVASTAQAQEWVMNHIPDSSNAGAALPADFTQTIEKEVAGSFNMPVTGLMFQNVYTGLRDSLASLLGKVTMVSIWTTTCRPCVAEMPILCAVQSELGAKGFMLLTVSAEDTARQRKFFEVKSPNHGGIIGSMRIEDYKYPFQCLLNPSGYIIDRQGILRDFWTGPRTHDELVARITKYL